MNPEGEGKTPLSPRRKTLLAIDRELSELREENQRLTATILSLRDADDHWAAFEQISHDSSPSETKCSIDPKNGPP